MNYDWGYAITADLKHVELCSSREEAEDQMLRGDILVQLVDGVWTPVVDDPNIRQ